MLDNGEHEARHDRMELAFTRLEGEVTGKLDAQGEGRPASTRSETHAEMRDRHREEVRALLAAQREERKEYGTMEDDE